MLRMMCAAPPPASTTPHESGPQIAIHIATLDRNLQSHNRIGTGTFRRGQGGRRGLAALSEPKADGGGRAAMGNERAKRARPDPVEGLLEWFEALLRRVVREELVAAGHPVDGWRDQRQSPLGPRNHCRAVRRRLEANPQDAGAKKVGDRFLLTADALAEEMDRLGRSPGGKAAGAATPRSPQSPEEEALSGLNRRLARDAHHQGRRRR
jgi:hypothetical protein